MPQFYSQYLRIQTYYDNFNASGTQHQKSSDPRIGLKI